MEEQHVTCTGVSASVWVNMLFLLDNIAPKVSAIICQVQKIEIQFSLVELDV